MNDRWDRHEDREDLASDGTNCESFDLASVLDERRTAHLTECERELVFVGVIYSEFDAGHPVRERDDDNRDEVNEREVFTDHRPVYPSPISTGLWAIFDPEKKTHKTFQKFTR